MSDAPQTQLDVQEVFAAYQRRLSAVEQDNILKEVTLATVQRESALKDQELAELRQQVAQYTAPDPAPVVDPPVAEAPTVPEAN